MTPEPQSPLDYEEIEHRMEAMQLELDALKRLLDATDAELRSRRESPRP